MTIRSRPLVACLALALTFGSGLAASACSDASDRPAPADPSDDASTPLPDAAPEAAPDASETEAGAKVCSKEGFCHTSVPPNETLRGVWSDGTVVWSVSEEGDVLRWDGTAWTIHASGLGELYAVWGSGPTDLWIGGAKGLYHGAGASSSSLAFTHEEGPDSAEIPILSIWGTSATNIWAVGGRFTELDVPESRLWHRSGGEGTPTWSVDPLAGEGRVFTHVWGTEADGVWILGNDSPGYPTTVLYHRAPSADAFVVLPVAGFKPAEGPELGLIGTIASGGRTHDGTLILAGVTRTQNPGYWYGRRTGSGAYAWTFGERDYKDDTLHAIWSAGTQAWAAGAYGRLRQWDGAKWRPAVMMVTDYPVIEPLFGIGGSSAEDFWVVGKNTAIHRTPGKSQ